MSSLRLALKQSLQETGVTATTSAAATGPAASRPHEGGGDEGDYSSENEYASDDAGEHGTLTSAGGGGTPSHRTPRSSSTSSKKGKSQQHQHQHHHEHGGGSNHSNSSSSHRDHSAANTIQAKWKHKQSQKTGDNDRAGGGTASSLPSQPQQRHHHQQQRTHSPRPTMSSTAAVEKGGGSSSGHDAAGSLSQPAGSQQAVAAAAASNAEPPNKKKKRKNKTVQPPSPALISFLSSMPPKTCRKHVAPGLRVKVRFATSVRNKDGKTVTKKKWFGGRVSAVSNLGSKIRIRYDDGTSEVTRFPDQDVIVDDTENGEHGAPADPFIPPPPPDHDASEDRTGDIGGDNDDESHDEHMEENNDDEHHPAQESAASASASAIPDSAASSSSAQPPTRRRNEDKAASAKRKRGRPTKSRDAPPTPSAGGAAKSAIAAPAAPPATADSDPNVKSVSSNPTSPRGHGKVVQGSSLEPRTDEEPNSALKPAPTLPVLNDNVSMADRGDSPSVPEQSSAMDVDETVAAIPSTDVADDEQRKLTSPPASRASPSPGEANGPELAQGSTITREDPSSANGGSVEDAPFNDAGAYGSSNDPVQAKARTQVADGALDDSGATFRPAVAKAPSFTIRISAAKAMQAVASEGDAAQEIQLQQQQQQQESSTEEAVREGVERDEDLPLATSAYPVQAATETLLEGGDSVHVGSPREMEQKVAFVDSAAPADANEGSRGTTSVEAEATGEAPALPKDKPAGKRLHIVIPKASHRDDGSPASGSGENAAVVGVESQPSASLDDKAAADRSPRPKKNKRKHVKEDGASQLDGTAVKRKKLEEEAVLPSAAKSPISRKRVLEVDANVDEMPVMNDPEEAGDSTTTPHARSSKDLIVRSFRRAAQQANERISSRPEAGSSDVPKKKRRKLPDGEDDMADPDGPAVPSAAAVGVLEQDAQVQCDSCGKWRIIPAIVVPTLPQQWYCSDNVWDPRRSSCDAPEQTEKQAAKEKKRRKRLQQRLAAAQAAEEEGEAIAAAASSGAASGAIESTGIPSNIDSSDRHKVLDHVLADEKSLTSSSHHPQPKPSKREESLSMASTASDDATAADKKRGRGRPRRAAIPVVPAPKESAPVPPVVAQPGQTKDDDNLEWVQCDSCSKWRKLPPHVSADDLPEVWYCTLNTWNPASASCDVPEDKADGLQDVGFHSGSGAGKLTYRNLIFGNTGRKANRPLSERARAAESLFLAPNDDEDAPPTVMYANSSCFVARGRSAATDENSGVSVFDLLNQSNLWSDLRRAQQNQGIGGERLMYYTYDTLPDDAQESAKELILSVIGDDSISSEEILRRARESSSKVRVYFSINVVVTCLYALVKQGLVDCVQKMGPDFTLHDWDPRYRRTFKAREQGCCTMSVTTESSSRSDAHKSSRCIKIAKPWKQRAH